MPEESARQNVKPGMYSEIKSFQKNTGIFQTQVPGFTPTNRSLRHDMLKFFVLCGAGMARANEAFCFGKIPEHRKNVQNNAKIYQPRKNPKDFVLRDC